MSGICQVMARWRIGRARKWHEPQDDGAEFWAKALAVSGDNEPPRIPPLVAESLDDVDEETRETLAACKSEGLFLFVRPDGLIPFYRLPFLLNHTGDPLAEWRVDRDGTSDQYTAIAEVPEDAAAKVRGIFHTSDRTLFLRARLVDDGFMRYGEVTRSALVELSATATPEDPHTTLMVGNPGSKWLPQATVERFARLELPDRMTFPAQIGGS